MKDKLIKIKNILSLKKLIAICLAIFVLYLCISTVVLTQKALSRKSLMNGKNADEIITAPLSEDKYIQWLEKNGEKGESYSSDYTAQVTLRNVESSNCYMVLLHPLTSDYTGMSQLAHHFYEMGFHVIVPNYISSETSYGVYEKNVLTSIVYAIINSNEDAQIYILGMGVGGATALLYSADDVPKQVKGIIADSPYVSAKKLFEDNAESLFGVSPFPELQLSSIYLKLFKGWSYKDADIREAVKKTDVPVLYIHGSEDNIVPIGHSNELYEVTESENTEHIRIVGAEHLQGYIKDSEKYYRETDSFIRKTLD